MLVELPRAAARCPDCVWNLSQSFPLALTAALSSPSYEHRLTVEHMLPPSLPRVPDLAPLPRSPASCSRPSAPTACPSARWSSRITCRCACRCARCQGTAPLCALQSKQTPRASMNSAFCFRVMYSGDVFLQHAAGARSVTQTLCTPKQAHILRSCFRVTYSGDASLSWPHVRAARGTA